MNAPSSPRVNFISSPNVNQNFSSLGYSPFDLVSKAPFKSAYQLQHQQSPLYSPLYSPENPFNENQNENIIKQARSIVYPAHSAQQNRQTIFNHFNYDGRGSATFYQPGSRIQNPTAQNQGIPLSHADADKNKDSIQADNNSNISEAKDKQQQPWYCNRCILVFLALMILMGLAGGLYFAFIQKAGPQKQLSPLQLVQNSLNLQNSKEKSHPAKMPNDFDTENNELITKNSHPVTKSATNQTKYDSDGKPANKTFVEEQAKPSQSNSSKPLNKIHYLSLNYQ